MIRGPTPTYVPYLCCERGEDLECERSVSSSVIYFFLFYYVFVLFYKSLKIFLRTFFFIFFRGPSLLTIASDRINQRVWSETLFLNSRLVNISSSTTFMVVSAPFHQSLSESTSVSTTTGLSPLTLPTTTDLHDLGRHE